MEYIGPIRYDNDLVTKKWVEDNTSSGHNILNEDGQEMTERPNLKFDGVNITDDPVYEATVIEQQCKTVASEIEWMAKTQSEKDDPHIVWLLPFNNTIYHSGHSYINNESSVVNTFNMRSGSVLPMAGDYDSSMITHGQSNVSDAINQLQPKILASTLYIGGQVRTTVEESLSAITDVLDDPKDYLDLDNKPQINGHTLTGDQASSDLGLQDTLSFDQTPTSGSYNVVYSNGIANAIANANNYNNNINKPSINNVTLSGNKSLSDLGISNISTPVSVSNGGTGNNSGYIRTGRLSGSTIGSYATIEGYQNVASSTASHAEGYLTTASGQQSHAEGLYTVASGTNAHAEGHGTSISNKYLTASGNYSHAEGAGTTASGSSSHAEGTSTSASGQESHAEGVLSTASGYRAHAEGYQTLASGEDSHAEGSHTTASDNQHTQGHHNVAYPGSTSGTNNTAFIIGNGILSSKSNAFRVTYAGSVYGKAAYNSSGADYAEYFEWLDSNPKNEDRIGYFVTLDGNKIKIAKSNDYILGVVSGHPSVIGNSDDDWLGRWMKDEFGRWLEDDFEDTDDEGNKYTYHNYVPNPDYDPSKGYIERKDRPEWDCVGFIGIIAVRDDGTCKVNGYCKCNDKGIATKSDDGYRVINRTSDNVVQIILK